MKTRKSIKFVLYSIYFSSCINFITTYIEISDTNIKMPDSQSWSLGVVDLSNIGINIVKLTEQHHDELACMN